MTRTRIPASALVAVAVLAVVAALRGTAGYAAGTVHAKVSGNQLIKKHSLSANRIKPDTVTGTQVNEASLATMPHAALADQLGPSALQPLTPIHGWTAGPDRPLGFRKDAAGFVHLQGSERFPGPAIANLLDLPPGARPEGTAYFGVGTGLSGATPGVIKILPDGSVIITNGDNANVAFDSISFYAGS